LAKVEFDGLPPVVVASAETWLLAHSSINIANKIQLNNLALLMGIKNLYN
jgi:hypothetical protein